MAAFAVVQSTSSNTVASNTTHAVTMPSGITAGDVLLAFSTFDTNAAATPSAGWTTINSTTSGAGLRFNVLRKIAAGSDTLTYTTGAGVTSAHAVYRIYSNDTTTQNGTAATGTSTTPNPPSLDNGASQKFIWIAAAGSTNAFSGYPTNYSDNQINSGTGNAHVSVATRSLEASSEDPGTFTTTSGAWAAQTLSIDEQATVTGNFPIITSDSTLFSPAIDFAGDGNFPILEMSSQIFQPTTVVSSRSRWTSKTKPTSDWTNINI